MALVGSLVALLFCAMSSSAAPPVKNLPDLTSSITAPSSVQLQPNGDAQFTMVVTVRNNGKQIAGLSSVVCRILDSNGVGTTLGLINVPSLTNGTAFQGSCNANANGLLTSITYTLQVIADSANAVAEKNETNNTSSQAITFTSPPTGQAIASWSWDPQGYVLEEFRLYMGIESGVYTTFFPTTAMEVTVSDLPVGYTYYFVVKAVVSTEEGLVESPPSIEASKTLN